MIRRGQVRWVDLGAREGSRPAGRRPVVVVQADTYNESRLATTLVVVITANVSLAAMPGNVFLPREATGLRRDSVANVTALATLNKRDLGNVAGSIPADLMHRLDEGLRRVVEL